MKTKYVQAHKTPLKYSINNILPVHVNSNLNLTQKIL